MKHYTRTLTLFLFISVLVGQPTFTEYSISTSADGGFSVYAADVDGDGDMDVLSASYNDDKIAWYENDGSEGFTEHAISTSADGAISVFAADVDGDGDMDVLSASYNDNKIAWYENDSSESFTEHAISDSADNARSVYAADVDGDGDMDVLSASANDDKVAWYENDGSESFTEHVISTSASRPNTVYAADVDGDGDMDVLSASNYDDKIAWYENDGNESFTEHAISTSADNAYSVYAADVDGDGDMDVLSASVNDDKIAWYENDGSEGFTEHAISTSADGAISVFAADVDGDGDMDVLSASKSDNKIAWYENDGSESFTEHAISDSADNAYSVYAADVDGDGDMDVLSASYYDDKIAWYEQEGSPPFQPQTTAELQTAVDLWVSDSASAVAAYGDINTWDVSLITDMSELFRDKTTFNDDISNWDVSNVTDMTAMFEDADALSDVNKCAIHTSFSSNSNWPYDWSNLCYFVPWYVSTTGSDSTGDGTYENPFATIQKGIDAANSGDTVSVAAGTYVENINYSGKNISVIGEDRETTIIDGNQNGSVVTFVNGEDSTTVLSGFTITNGEGDQWIGGGININNSDPLLNSLIITNNNGGGIYSSGSTVEIDSVDFAYNSSSNNGAAINSIESTVKVQNSTFSLNTSDNIGGAIYVDPLTTCEIYNSSFDNNEALWGGAIATVGGGKLLVEGCNISFNTASGNNPNPNENYPTFGGGGGIYQEWSDSLEIYDSEITNNTAATGAGGGIAVYLSNDVTINNIVLSDNSSSGPNYPSGGGGAAFYRADNVLFENSTIANNVSNHNSGGGIFLGSESGQASIVVYATFNRLTLVNNSALSGGAIFCWSAILNLYHSTLAQNEASNSEWSGGGLASHYVSRPNIISSLFYNNLPNSIHNGYPQTPVLVAYSLVQEWWTGWGNLVDIDPLFCDPDSGDYSLAENSPCVGTGEDGANMGAFDIGCDAIILNISDELVPITYTLHQNYPNPFNPVTTLRYDLPENAMINITIYDMLGRQVKTLINQTQDAGYRSVIWDATNDYGKPVSAGIYLYQIQAGEYISTKKMVLLK